MSQSENFGSFIKENRKLVSDYINTRIEIIRLQGIRASSKAIASLIWILVSLFLFSVIFIFIGLVLGFWLSDLTGSFIAGFGYTTLILIAVTIIISLLREQLFINPILRKMLSKLDEKDAIDPDESL